MRVTTTLLFNTAISYLHRQQARLARAHEQAASGKQVLRPADDPVGARRILELRGTLRGPLAQFADNRATASTLLASADSTLAEMETLLLRAKSLALSAANATASPQTRAAMAVEVGDLLHQLVALGNTRVAGHFLFAGRAQTEAPFSLQAATQSTPGGLVVAGSLTPLEENDLLINGTAIRPTQEADDPVSTSDNAASALALATAINEAAAVTGVKASATTTLALTASSFGDLSAGNLVINGVPVTGAIASMDDLVVAINAAGVPGVVASAASATTLVLTAADGRNIQLETDGQASSGMTFVEFDLGGGAALNQVARGTLTLSASQAFTLSGLAPGHADLRAGAVNPVARYGGDAGAMQVAIAPGQTLAVTQAGSRVLGAHLHPALDRQTPLSSLRQGQGIAPGALVITDRAGNSATVDLSGAVTVGDVLDAISAAPGINVTAAISDDGRSLVLRDDNPQPLYPLTVADAAGSTTASDLGLAAARPGDIVGAPLRPLLTPATPIGLLGEGRGRTLTAIRIHNGDTTVDVDLSTAQTIDDVIAAINAAGANVTARLNAAGTALEVRSNDPQTVAVVTEVDGGTNAADLGLQSLLGTLSLLQEALQKDDTGAIGALLESLDAGLSGLLSLRAETGAGMQRLERVEAQLAERELHLRTLLSDTEDADVVEVFSQLSQLTAGLEALLAATARIVQPTLLDFLR
ncbi:MAG: hypothetical protein KatS3mg131_1296 [Candidatus Tectimicrobiota bacterium]|nr:MAG: hypothetical protein KatS3mg131_1296 [Candidatus Tectomicrobia bacterium]